MTDAELQRSRRAYAADKSPENLARLLKAAKRAGEDWQALFNEKVRSLYVGPVSLSNEDSTRFKNLNACLQDFVREETDDFLHVYPEMKNDYLDVALGECGFPRVFAWGIRNCGLEKLRKYRSVLKKVKIRVADSVGNPFVKKLCESGFPIVELNLSDSKVTDKGVQSIASSSLPLAELYLTRTRVTDNSLEYLAQSSLPLEKLNVRQTRVSWIAAEDYKQVKKDVEVEYDAIEVNIFGGRTLT